MKVLISKLSIENSALSSNHSGGVELIESYKYYSNKYENTILIFKIGVFCELINNDALIFNKIFNYKLKFGKDYVKVGFPNSKEKDIFNKLDSLSINYIILEKDSSFFNIQCNKKFNNNNYTKYLLDNINTVLYNKYKIDKIYDKLLDKVLDNDIDNIIDEVFKLI